MGTLWVEKTARPRHGALGTLEATAPHWPWPSRQAPAKAPASRWPRPFRPSTTAPRPPMFCGCCAIWPATLRSPPRCAPTIPRWTRQGLRAAARFEKLLEQPARHDFSWFFADWVDADKGLPDLTIESVFPTAAQAGNWLVAVNVANHGYAAAEVPVTVRSAEYCHPAAARGSRPRQGRAAHAHSGQAG